MDNTINDYIDICIGSNGSHYDVSKVIYEVIKNKFKYMGKNIWKYNDEIVDDKNNYLKNELKSSILLQIAGKLKDSKYIISIIKELKQFFPDNIDE